MMGCTPFRCDRCGREITNMTDDFVYRYKTYTGAIDLCTECNDAFMEFMTLDGDTND